jgi:putative transposase
VLKNGVRRAHSHSSEPLSWALEHSGITCSMSRKGNYYDNAAMEGWFSTLKTELGDRFESHSQAKTDLFDVIKVFYNRQRGTRLWSI